MSDANHQVNNPAGLYQFSGYAPPLIQLDETGPAYWISGVHPYYKNQPEYWSTRATYTQPGTINVRNNPINETLYPQYYMNEIEGYDPSIMTQNKNSGSNLYNMLNF